MSVCTTKMIYLLNVSDVQNPDTGIRSKAVSSFRKVFADVTNVGSIIQITATAAGTILSNQVELRQKAYKGETYVAYKNDGEITLYEVKTTVKGKSPEFIKLNVQKSKIDIEGVDSIV